MIFRVKCVGNIQGGSIYIFSRYLFSPRYFKRMTKECAVFFAVLVLSIVEVKGNFILPINAFVLQTQYFINIYFKLS